jgi:hypothetical protein
LLEVGQVNIGTDLPILQNTKFGWVVSGKYNKSQTNAGSKCHLSIVSSNNSFHNELKQFWEVEESLSGQKELSPEEVYCEQHFLNNISRDHSGRFIVKLPVSNKIKELGDSKTMALKRLQSLEKRLQKIPNARKRFQEFIDEYLDLGHMEMVPEFDGNSNDNSKTQY